MSNAVMPISGLARRIPIVAKLRSGVVKGNRPTSLNTWRITTSSRPFAEAFASRYGGTVTPMNNDRSPHDWEVTSDTNEVAIALIDDGYSIAYELWAGSGCQRRCDGVTAEVIQTTGPDNVEYVPGPCICDRKGVLECSLKSRLTLILPDLPFSGGVVYESGSKNFAEEAQGMLRLVQQLQAQGVQRGVLRLEQRKSSGNRKYTIAVVGVSESLEALASGQTGVGSLGRAEDNRPELAAGESPPSPAAPRGVEAPPSSAPHPTSAAPLVEQVDDGPGRSQGGSQSADTGPSPTSGGDGALGEDASSPSEDIVDAEIVDEDDNTTEVVDGAQFKLDPSERARIRSAFMAQTKSQLGLDYETQVKPWLRHKYGGGWSDLSDADAWNLHQALIVPDGTRQQKEERGEQFKATVLEHLEAQP